jgi:hypothetical protein
MKRNALLFLPILFILSSCSNVPQDQYTRYFDGSFTLDSVTDWYGPTVMIGEDAVIFSGNQMTTYTIDNPGHSSTSYFEVSRDSLILGGYQSFRILQATETKIIYAYHKPIATGSDKWEFTYYLTRIPPHNPGLEYSEKY